MALTDHERAVLAKIVEAGGDVRPCDELKPIFRQLEARRLIRSRPGLNPKLEPIDLYKATKAGRAAVLP
jgi:hypothetical protein